MKRRDTLREEYGTIAEALNMITDVIKVGMQYESKERWTKKELEANQIKYNIIGMI